MENLSDKEKQKLFINERDRIRDQKGRMRRAPFIPMGLVEVILGLITSVIGIFFLIHFFSPDTIGHIPLVFGIGFLVLGIILLIIADKFGRRKF